MGKPYCKFSILYIWLSDISLTGVISIMTYLLPVRTLRAVF